MKIPKFADGLEMAFGWRKRPDYVCPVRGMPTTEQEDAMWFMGKDWRDISSSGWTAHLDAIFAFNPDAFRYYLPSILKLSVATPTEWFWPADSLLQMLDRSPVVEYWDDFILTRLLGLEDQEYAVLEEWLLLLEENCYNHSVERAFDTIGLLRQCSKQAQTALSQ